MSSQREIPVGEPHHSAKATRATAQKKGADRACCCDWIANRRGYVPRNVLIGRARVQGITSPSMGKWLQNRCGQLVYWAAGRGRTT